MTMTEKIFAKASKKTELSPGENVWVDVDVLMTHDVCGPGSIGIFKKEFGENAKVFYFSNFYVGSSRFLLIYSQSSLIGVLMKLCYYKG